MYIHKKIQKFAKNHDRSKVLPRSKINDGNDGTIILETAVQDDKVMQDFEL